MTRAAQRRGARCPSSPRGCWETGRRVWEGAGAGAERVGRDEAKGLTAGCAVTWNLGGT